MADLPALVERLRALPGVLAKADIGLVAEVLGGGDWYAGPGDDGAVLPDGAGSVVVGGEATLPAVVAADPYGAGIAAVLANVNDLAAMGARPVAQGARQRVQPDGAGWRAVDETQHVHGGRRDVVLVGVAGREQALLGHEHRAADPVVCREFRGRCDRSAAVVGPPDGRLSDRGAEGTDVRHGSPRQSARTRPDPSRPGIVRNRR
ncbi:MAG: AIR synthase related protein [Blastococcus sp.]